MRITNAGQCIMDGGADDRIEVVISCEHPELYLDQEMGGKGGERK